MAGSDNKRSPGLPNTYAILDRESQEELERLQVFDRMLTAGMGGVLSEQADPTMFKQVLDVGCGTGGWLIALAKSFPSCTKLVGIDASRKFIEYARAQAESEGVSDRVEFHVMDALRMLEFPDGSFDLVNHRSASGWLRTWDWPKLLQEYRRVCTFGGVVRVSEPAYWVSTSSPALMQYTDLLVRAFHQAGYFFRATYEGVTEDLEPLFVQHGVQNIRTRLYTMQYRTGTQEGQYFYENIRMLFKSILPLLRKWAQVPDDYDTLCQKVLEEIQQPDFVATMKLMTIWGQA